MMCFVRCQASGFSLINRLGHWMGGSHFLFFFDVSKNGRCVPRNVEPSSCSWYRIYEGQSTLCCYWLPSRCWEQRVPHDFYPSMTVQLSAHITHLD
jgi:hypothetical protein